jgi:nucleoside phosphorylase
MGNLNAALETQRAIDVWNPRLLFLTGIAGGFKDPNRYLGDVLVADQMIYYELGKARADGTTLRPQVFRPSSALISATQLVAASPDPWIEHIACERPDGTTRRIRPEVHIGPVLTGEKVVTTDQFLNEFRSSWTNILGVEMEAAGSALAVYTKDTQPEFLMVKGISDWADAAKADSWQTYAAHAAAAFVLRLLEIVSPKSAGSPVHPPPKRTLRVNCAGQERMEVCKRLYANWEDIADYYDVARGERARFRAGREMMEMWEWLKDRGDLDGLPSALEYLGRSDIMRDFPCMNPS